ncbi:hypothetical protein RB195_003038 [Necator americanus]|uniref:Uncharacterized protein n=1 Tax=Necator americanus TaxID=51031 RepID=A0ABR1DLX4_NECAM
MQWLFPLGSRAVILVLRLASLDGIAMLFPPLQLQPALLLFSLKRRWSDPVKLWYKPRRQAEPFIDDDVVYFIRFSKDLCCSRPRHNFLVANFNDYCDVNKNTMIGMCFSPWE